MNAEPSTTLAEQAFNLLHRAVVTGVLPPGTRLKIADLEQRFSIGATPLREGLSRLASSGIVEGLGQKGFRVCELSPQDLHDITIARIAVETEGLKRSMSRGDLRWEGEIVSFMHQMQHHLNSMTALDDDKAAFHVAHKGFHMALVSASGSSRLQSLSSSLYDQADRYRRMMLASAAFGMDQFVEEHSSLMDLVLSRKRDEACRRLQSHLEATYLAVYGEIPK